MRKRNEAGAEEEPAISNRVVVVSKVTLEQGFEGGRNGSCGRVGEQETPRPLGRRVLGLREAQQGGQ